VPDAFGDLGLTLALAYAAVRAAHIALFVLASRGDPQLRRSVASLAVSTAIGVGLLVAGAMVDSEGGRAAFWGLALALDMAGPFFFGSEGWRLEPGHFVERHGLIVIIAIGESLVAIGLGERDSGIGTGVMVAAMLGFAVATSFWLAYFDFFTIRARQILSGRSGVARTALARDVFTYLHLPMVAGIVLFAFAMKKTLADVGGELATIPALGLCVGPALYLFAYVALRLRVSRTLGGGRLVAAVACALLWPVATVVPALAALTLVAVVWVGLHAYEIIWWRDARAQTRAALRAPAS